MKSPQPGSLALVIPNSLKGKRQGRKATVAGRGRNQRRQDWRMKEEKEQEEKLNRKVIQESNKEADAGKNTDNVLGNNC